MISVCTQSTPRAQQTPTNNPSSYTSPDPTLSNMLPIKKRIMHYIYNFDTTNSFWNFALFSKIDDPLAFEEAIKDDVWKQSMVE